MKQKLKEESLKNTIDKANNTVKGLQLEKQKLKLENKRHKSEIKDLKDQLAITRQEARILGKRDAPETVDETAALLEAVTNQVKRNRRANHPNDAPVTL